MSDFFPIRMNQEYLFSVDMKGASGFAWVYGYTSERKKQGKSESYRAPLHLVREWAVPLPGEEKINPDGWVRYERTFTIKQRRRKSDDPEKRGDIDIEWARVKLFSLGTFYSKSIISFDNIIVRPLIKENNNP